jgi:Flp pilus assembly protein TadD
MTPVETLLEQARLLTGIGRYDDALERLRRAAATRPDDAVVHFNRAWTLHSAGRPAECLAAAETGCGLDPADEWGHRLRGRALLKLGRNAEALDAARTALRLDAEHSHVHVLLSDAEEALGNLPAAAAAAAKAAELDPESPIAHDRVGRLALQTGEIDRAEAAFRRVLAIDAGAAYALELLAEVMLRRRDDRAAIELLTSALVADPELATARARLAEVAHRWLWGRRLQLPGTAPGVAWFAVLAVVNVGLFLVLALVYLAWLPLRTLRAAVRWRRMPERAKPFVADRERRRVLDTLATLGLLSGPLTALVAGIGPGPEAGPAGIAGWITFLAALAVSAAALVRVLPRVLGAVGARAGECEQSMRR